MENLTEPEKETMKANIVRAVFGLARVMNESNADEIRTAITQFDDCYSLLLK